MPGEATISLQRNETWYMVFRSSTDDALLPFGDSECLFHTSIIDNEILQLSHDLADWVDALQGEVQCRALSAVHQDDINIPAKHVCAFLTVVGCIRATSSEKNESGWKVCLDLNPMQAREYTKSSLEKFHVRPLVAS